MGVAFDFSEVYESSGAGHHTEKKQANRSG
jgi:hypothetical protein